MTFSNTAANISFHAAPGADGFESLREAVALVPGDPLMTLPAAGILAVMLACRLMRGARLSPAGGR